MPVTVQTRGLVLIEHEFQVPLDHGQPNGERISVFAREVADPEGRDRPFLVFFEGGPGHEGQRPTRHPSSPGWLDRALQEFRVLFLDGRGTGRSTPVGTRLAGTPAQQADYLKLMRADSIVKDAEWIRSALGVERWSVLGQSFGGFCVLSYLSMAPDALREALFTGGLPPVGLPVDDVYRATYERMIERSHRYYRRYPEDRARVLALRQRLESGEVILPAGDHLTSRRFRQLGNALGMSDGAERLHYIVELPVDSPAFLHDVESALGFCRNPIYAVIHEACYADGNATRWSAHRLLPELYEQNPELWTGEHIFPWMFQDYQQLAPLAEAADLLAEYTWPRLYDEVQLAANQVPAAAAIYAEDAYVERRFSEETAGLVKGLRPWVTNEYEHNGLRVDGAHILGRLLDLARGQA
jgi:pimeloyl-ACP methyl ester carboxylesterase